MADTLANRPNGSEAAKKLRAKLETADAQTFEIIYKNGSDWGRLRTAVQLMTKPAAQAAQADRIQHWRQ
jgi:hypothetical protein